MKVWPTGFGADIGKIVELEFSDSRSHKRIGYLASIRADIIALARYDPRIEAQKGYWSGVESLWDYLSHRLQNVDSLQELQVPLLTPELVPNLVRGMPLQYRVGNSVGVGYVSKVTPSKILFDQHEPFREDENGWFHRINWKTSYKLDELAVERARVAVR